jgi:hypothetical protein
VDGKVLRKRIMIGMSFFGSTTASLAMTEEKRITIDVATGVSHTTDNNIGEDKASLWGIWV